jgi:hypothetical protein
MEFDIKVQNLASPKEVDVGIYYLLRKIEAETKVYLVPRSKRKRKDVFHYFNLFQLIASASSSKMCIKFVFEDVGVGCVYNFVIQAIPIAKNPIRKEMASDTCLKILNFQFKSMPAQVLNKCLQTMGYLFMTLQL